MNRAYVLHPYVIIGIGIIVFLFVCVYHVREGFAAKLTCRDVSTQAESIVDRSHYVHLGAHDIRCNDDEMLSQLQLTRPNFLSIRYNYFRPMVDQSLCIDLMKYFLQSDQIYKYFFLQAYYL